LLIDKKMMVSGVIMILVGGTLTFYLD